MIHCSCFSTFPEYNIIVLLLKLFPRFSTTDVIYERVETFFLYFKSNKSNQNMFDFEPRSYRCIISIFFQQYSTALHEQPNSKNFLFIKLNYAFNCTLSQNNNCNLQSCFYFQFIIEKFQIFNNSNILYSIK